jgi:hypothetical protein
LPEVVAGEAGGGGGEGLGEADGGAVVEGGGVALVRGEDLGVGEARWEDGEAARGGGLDDGEAEEVVVGNR